MSYHLLQFENISTENLMFNALIGAALAYGRKRFVISTTSLQDVNVSFSNTIEYTLQYIRLVSTVRVLCV